MSYSQTVLITGAAGMLGQALVRKLKDIDHIKLILLYHKQNHCRDLPKDAASITVDLKDQRSLEQKISSATPTHVFHCAAERRVDWCETNFSEAFGTNCLGTRNLVSSCLARNSECHFTYISTDAVYSDSNGKKIETERPVPQNNYGLTKLWGEDIVRLHTDHHLIVRTTIVGLGKNQFLQWVLDQTKIKREIPLFEDVMFTPISVDILAAILSRNLKHRVCGTFNISGSQEVSKATFAKHLIDYLGLEARYRFVSASSVDRSAKRSFNMNLDTSKATQFFGKMPTIDDIIKDVAKNYSAIES